MTHEILSIGELCALLEKALLGSGLLLRLDLSGLVVPVDLELGYTGLLSQNVTGQVRDVNLRRRVLVEFRCVVLGVDVVANSQELLAVLVGAGEQHGCHAHDVVFRESAWVRRLPLIDTMISQRHDVRVHYLPRTRTSFILAWCTPFRPLQAPDRIEGPKLAQCTQFSKSSLVKCKVKQMVCE